MWATVNHFFSSGRTSEEQDQDQAQGQGQEDDEDEPVKLFTQNARPMKFFLSDGVPMRSHIEERIRKHGGIVAANRQGAIYLEDKIPETEEPDAFSYRFVEDTVRNLRLESLEKHRIPMRPTNKEAEDSIADGDESHSEDNGKGEEEEGSRDHVGNGRAEGSRNAEGEKDIIVQIVNSLTYGKSGHKHRQDFTRGEDALLLKMVCRERGTRPLSEVFRFLAIHVRIVAARLTVVSAAYRAKLERSVGEEAETFV